MVLGRLEKDPWFYIFFLFTDFVHGHDHDRGHGHGHGLGVGEVDLTFG